MKSVCLLRAVNVGGRKASAAELRAMAAELGFEGAQTLLASGNLVLDPGKLAGAELEAALEAAFEARFGFFTEFMCRTAAQWRTLLEACPFPEAARVAPSRLLAFVPKAAPATDAVERLRALAQDGEQVERAGDVIWIWFDAGVGTSKLSTARGGKAFGAAVTARNHNTVVKLAALAEA